MMESEAASRQVDASSAGNEPEESVRDVKDIPGPGIGRSGQPSRSCFTLELCCGSAGLSAQLRKVGFTTVAVDHSSNQHTPKVACLNLDLTKPSSWEILRNLAQERRVIYVHIAPPCGTATRARDRPVPLKLRQRGAPNPKPLRSPQHPEGLPDLKGINAAKVKSANAIYEAAAEFLDFCHGLGIWFTCENPTRSYMWQTRWSRKLRKLNGVQPVDFQACMHGSTRDKWSTWLTNIPELQVLRFD